MTIKRYTVDPQGLLVESQRGGFVRYVDHERELADERELRRIAESNNEYGKAGMLKRYEAEAERDRVVAYSRQLRAQAGAFARHVAEQGVTKWDADEDEGIEGGRCCLHCNERVLPDGVIVHEGDCIVGKAEAFVAALSENPAPTDAAPCQQPRNHGSVGPGPDVAAYAEQQRSASPLMLVQLRETAKSFRLSGDVGTAYLMENAADALEHGPLPAAENPAQETKGGCDQQITKLESRLKWTRDRWQDVVEDADQLCQELHGKKALEHGGLIGGIYAVADNERHACDAALSSHRIGAHAEEGE